MAQRLKPRMDWAYVLYGAPGAPLWHQRLVLGRVALSACDMVCMSPDGDVYSENFGDGNDDIQAVRYGSFDRPPLGVPRQAVYRFRAEPTAAEVAGARREAQVVAEQECRDRALALGNPGLLQGLVCLAPMVGAAAGAAPVAAQPLVGVLRGVVPAPAPGGVDGVWRAAMSLGPYRYGDEVAAHTRTAACVGDRDLHDLGQGVGLFVELVTAATESSFYDRAVDADARVLGIRRNKQGKREITWREMRERVREEDFGEDWALPGPRTSLWCIEFVDQEGLGIEGHHERFKSACRLQVADWGVQEHFQLCVQLKHSLLVDQLDGTNLVSVETKFRRLQTIEFAHGDRAREAESLAVGGKMSLEEQTVFSGSTRTHTSVMVCPKLLDHVRVEVERDAKLAKCLRSAREEREEKKKSAAAAAKAHAKGGRKGQQGEEGG